MANRYWVGGNATWDGTAGTKWAATSGGTGGQSVPTTADDVFFDANSLNRTVTISAGNTGAKSITCTGFTGTIAGSSDITVAGSITLVAGMTYTHTGTKVITATATITSAGKTFSGLTVNGAGITVTLGDALTMGANGGLTLTQGTFNSANFNISGAQIQSTNSNARTLTLGSSTVTLSTVTPINFSTSTNLTFNANTSTLVFSNNSTTFNGAGLTYYNVEFSSSGVNADTSITGANTYNNLKLADISTGGAGCRQILLSANQTVNGTLTATGGSGNRRVFVRSNTLGTARTITAASESLTDVDFSDITAAGAGAPFTGTRLGNCANNTNITFDAAKTVYWSLAAGGNFTSTAFATSSNGTPALTNFPLAQDTLIIDDAGLTTGNTITVSAGYNYGTITVTRTNGFTFAISSTLSAHGNITLTSATTTTGAGSLVFLGRKTQTFDAAGKTFAGVSLEAPNTTLSLAGNLNITPNGFTMNGYVSNTLTTNNFNITTLNIVSNQGTFNLGSSTITCTSTGNIFNISGGANSTINAGTSTIIFSDTSVNGKTFTGAGKTYYNLVLGAGAGTCTYTIAGSNTFNSISSNKSVAYTVSLTSGTTQTVTTWDVNGSSGNVLTLQRSSTTNATIAKAGGGTATINYATITGITGSPASTWYATNSTDGGNNTNITFGSPPIAVSITELQTLSESVSTFLSYNFSITEIQTLADSQNVQAVFVGLSNETQTLSDVNNGIASYFIDITETQTLTDSVIGGGLITVFINESQAISDDLSGNLIITTSINESQSLFDINGANIGCNVSLQETQILSDSNTVGFGYTVSITELQTLGESSAKVYFANATISELFAIEDLDLAITNMVAETTENQTFSDSYKPIGWYVPAEDTNNWNNVASDSNEWEDAVFSTNTWTTQ